MVGRTADLDFAFRVACDSGQSIQSTAAFRKILEKHLPPEELDKISTDEIADCIIRNVNPKAKLPPSPESDHTEDNGSRRPSFEETESTTHKIRIATPGGDFAVLYGRHCKERESFIDEKAVKDHDLPAGENGFVTLSWEFVDMERKGKILRTRFRVIQSDKICSDLAIGTAHKEPLQEEEDDCDQEDSVMSVEAPYSAIVSSRTSKATAFGSGPDEKLDIAAQLIARVATNFAAQREQERAAATNMSEPQKKRPLNSEILDETYDDFRRSRRKHD